MNASVKAKIYVVVGMIMTTASLMGMALMYLSPTFLPVYVKDTYVIGQQICRYALYAVLFVIFVLSVALADYGLSFLIKKLQRKRRHNSAFFF